MLCLQTQMAARTLKRKPSTDLVHSGKRPKVELANTFWIPMDIWEEIEKHLASVAARTALRLVCKHFASLFAWNNKWVRVEGCTSTWGRSAALRNCLDRIDPKSPCTYQVITFCHVDRPHFLQYQVCIRDKNAKLNAFNLTFSEYGYLAEQVGMEITMDTFPAPSSLESVEEWIRATNHPLDGCEGIGLDTIAVGDKFYVLNVHGNCFLFLEFCTSESAVKSYEWVMGDPSAEDLTYNTPFCIEESDEEWNESTFGMHLQHGLLCVACAFSIFFFNPATSECWGYQFVDEEEGGYDEFRLVPPGENGAPGELLVFGEDNKNVPRETHPYPKPGAFTVSDHHI